jgi:hypothetical protein
MVDDNGRCNLRHESAASSHHSGVVARVMGALQVRIVTTLQFASQECYKLVSRWHCSLRCESGASLHRSGTATHVTTML